MVAGKRYSAYGSTKLEAAERLEEKVNRENGCLPPVALTLKSWMETAYIPTLARMTPKTKEKAGWAIKHLGKLGDIPMAEVSRHNLQTICAASHLPELRNELWRIEGE